MQNKLLNTLFLNIALSIGLSTSLGNPILPKDIEENVEPATQANRPGDNGGGFASKNVHFAELIDTADLDEEK